MPASVSAGKHFLPHAFSPEVTRESALNVRLLRSFRAFVVQLLSAELCAAPIDEVVAAKDLITALNNWLFSCTVPIRPLEENLNLALLRPQCRCNQRPEDLSPSGANGNNLPGGVKTQSSNCGDNPYLSASGCPRTCRSPRASPTASQ